MIQNFSIPCNQKKTNKKKRRIEIFTRMCVQSRLRSKNRSYHGYDFSRRDILCSVRFVRLEKENLVDRENWPAWSLVQHHRVQLVHWPRPCTIWRTRGNKLLSIVAVIRRCSAFATKSSPCHPGRTH